MIVLTFGINVTASAETINVINSSFEISDCDIACTNGSWERGASGAYAASVPNGNQIARKNNDSPTQTLSATLTVDPLYTLTFDIGGNRSGHNSRYRVELRAETTVLDLLDHYVMPAIGTFDISTLSYTALGNTRETAFIKTGGGQLHFDNVQLTAVPPSCLCD